MNNKTPIKLKFRFLFNGVNKKALFLLIVLMFLISNGVQALTIGDILNGQVQVLAAATPAFVQMKENSLTTAGTIVNSGVFASPVTSGNLLVAWVWYNSSSQSVSSITDTASNTYIKVIGPTTGTGGLASWRQELWYTKNVTAGSLDVTATFNGSISGRKAITVHEYSGIDITSPLDGVSVATPSSANASSGSITTTVPSELIFGAGVFYSAGTAGTGFALRSSIQSNASEDMTVSSTGSYAAVFNNSAQDSIVQMAAFKAAGSVPQTPAVPTINSFTSAPSSITTGGSSSLSWNVTAFPAAAISIDNSVGTVTGSSVTVNPTTTKTYTLTVANSQGSVSAQTTVTVSAPVAPAISSFTASPSSVTSGGSSTLSWSASGVPSPTFSISGIGAVAGSSVSVSPSVTTAYTLTATNSAGSATANATVTVQAPPPPPPASGNGAPVLFFSDLQSGPKTGGENNNGVFVTLYGNNFGSNPSVTVGGGAAIVKMQPTTHLWYQKMVIQLGSAAASGNIIVSNSNGTSNGLPFSMRSGNIYFTATSGSDSATGAFATPFRTIVHCKDALSPGDTCYVMNGVNETGSENYGAAVVLGSLCNAASPCALVTYPGASVTIGSVNGGGLKSCSGLSGCSNGSYWIVAGFNLRSNGVAMEFTTNWMRGVGNNIQCPNGDGQQGCVDTAQGSAGNVGTRLYGNEVTNAGRTDTSPTKLYHAVYIGTNATNIDFGWNWVHNNNACRGINVHSTGGSALFDLHFHDNILNDTRCDAISLAEVAPINGTVEVYNNVIYNGGYGGGAFPEGFGLYYCVFVGSSGGGGTVQIYNNTFYNCGYPAQGYGGTMAVGVPEDPSNKGVSLRNNISYQPNGLAYFVSYTSGPVTGSNNIWFGNGNGPSQTTGNINADPKVTSAAGHDFHLLSVSPAVDGGTTIIGLTMDRDGVLRPQGSSYDIGVYEFSSTFTPPPLDTIAPSIPTNLSATAISSSQINLSWTASTDNVGVIGYKIFRGGLQIGTSAINSYSDSGLTSSTIYSYTVSAYDATLNNSAQSSSVSATTQAPPLTPDVTAPIVALTSPSAGTVSGTITLSATASDPAISGAVTSGLALLSLSVDGTIVATSTSANISKPLDTTTLTNASHSLTATAKDNAGNNSTVASVTITVNNPIAQKFPRTITLTSLEGLTSIPANQSITATILSGASILETQSNLVPSAGKYTVTFLSSDPQLVDIRIKINGYLSNKLTSIDTTVNSPSALSVNQLLAGDFNNDNVINALDFSVLNSHWLQNFPSSDINIDGLINSLDFAVLKNNYNKVGM